MDNSFLNFIIFIVTTILYFLIKPTPPLIDDNNPTSNQSSGYMMLCAYFLVVIVTQFFINSYIITTSCGGNISSNLKEAALYTFMPWTLIFGVVIISVIAYPDIKSAFSDVYGYYYVAGSANNIITDLLINVPLKDESKDGSNTYNNIVEPNAVSAIPVNNSPIAPNSLVEVNQMGGSKSFKGGAATLEENRDLIVKICGNMSILINQIVPANFSYYWNTMLSPLFKDKYKNATDESSKNELLKKKEELYDLVVSRDNIGEGMWYIYTGVLLCSLVQYKLSGVGCKSDQKTLEANYTKFRDDKAAAEKAKAKTTATANPQ
jgi:hypothetical protein